MPPTRRASAAAASVPASNASLASSATRVHRAHDSQNAYAMPAPANPAGGPHHKTMRLLIDRLKHKSPFYSGRDLVEIEGDEAVLQAVESLVDLSRDFPDFVGWNIAHDLEALAKSEGGSPSIPKLQSFLFLLKVLAVCMSARWRMQEDSRPGTQNGDYASSGMNTPVDAPSPVGGRSARGYTSRETIEPLGGDLPPLETTVAKYMLSVMVFFLKQAAPAEGTEKDAGMSHTDFEVHNEPRPVVFPDGSPLDTSPGTRTRALYSSAGPVPHGVRARTSTASFGSSGLRVPSAIPPPRDASVYAPTPSTLADSLTSLSALIAKWVGIVVYQLSASNWSVVFHRIRQKIHTLENLEKGTMPDTTDLQLMSECALDRSRLIQLLKEVASLTMSMQRDAMLVLAVPLAAAVWHWIDLYPEEFGDAISARGRMDGAPEQVIDVLGKELSQPETKHIVWPTLTVLMCISYDRVNVDFNLEHGGGVRKMNRKEVKLVDQLVKAAVSSSKFQPIALRCIIDICKAASRAPKRDLPLRALALDITHEIRSNLLKFPNQRPFWESANTIDPAIYSDALVMLWRFLPEDESVDIFGACLQPDRSHAVKLCAISAMHTLAREAQQWSEQVPPYALWKRFTVRIRVMYQNISLRRPEVEDGVARYASPTPRSKGFGHNTMRLDDREMLLIAILALWRADVATYFLGLEGSDSSFLDYFAGGKMVRDDGNEYVVRLAMSRSFNFLLDTAFVMQPGDPFVEQTTVVLPNLTPRYIFTACCHLLNARTDYESQEMWVSILQGILRTYTRPSQLAHVDAIKMAEQRVPAFVIAEIVLLVLLTSVNSKVSITAAQTLRLLAYAERETEVEHPFMPNADTARLRLSFFDDIGLAKLYTTGRVKHQKAIRDLVRRIAAPTSNYVLVWQECYCRWAEVSQYYTAMLSGERNDGRVSMLPTPMSEEDMHHQWRNLTLFLAAFGGACVLDGPYDQDGLAKTIPMQYVPDMAYSFRDPDYLVDLFLDNLIDQLVSPNIGVRDVARDALGTELSPKLYPKLYKHLDRTIQDLVKHSDSPWNDDYNVFLDQFITLLHMLLDHLASAPSDKQMSVDIGSTLFTLGEFIARFNHDASLGRLRVKFCLFVESAAKRADVAGLVPKDTFANHVILDMIAGWVVIDPKQAAKKIYPSHREINTACLRAIVHILEKCPTPPDNGPRDEDPIHNMTRFGHRYSELILGIGAFDRADAGDDSGSGDTSHSQRVRASKIGADLLELVVTGVVHIAAANPQNAVRLNIYRAFDADVEIRTIFIVIMDRALRKGFKPPAAQVQELGVRKQKLCELVKSPDLTLALAVCETCPANEVEFMTPVLFNIFDSRASLMELLKVIIEREVHHTTSETDIFRGNNVCTRMLSYFGKVHGYYYLRQLVGSLVKLLESVPADADFELDPSRVGEQASAQNMATVTRVASAFLDMLASSVSALPSMFREICAHIARSVSAVYPEAKFSALGAFIFLRFISPAIVAPETIDIEVPQSRVIRKGLMLVAKISQNLANNVFFGKEQHMTALNQYLRENIVTVTRFLSELHKYVPRSDGEEGDEWLGTSFDEADTLVLHRFFERHIDKVGKELLSLQKDREGDLASGNSLWNELCSALVDISHNSEGGKGENAEDKNRAYYDLMDRMGYRSTDGVKDTFVEIPTAKDQSALFVLSMGAINIEKLEIDLLVYHMLQLLCSPVNVRREYEVIIDWTRFNASCELPMQWLKYCFELIPEDVRERFSKVHNLNPNQAAQKYMRRIATVFSDTGPSMDVAQYTSVADLREDVPPAVHAPLGVAVKLENEDFQDFYGIGMRQASQLRILVHLKVGTTHIRVASLKAQPISSRVSCKTMDIIELTDVSDVYNVSLGHDVHEFVIRQRHGAAIYFNSEDRDAIVKAIKDARGRLRGLRLVGANDVNGVTLETDIHAILLHAGMGNVCHDNQGLRAASMDIITGICADLNLEEVVEMARGAFVACNPSAFVVQLSEHLAPYLPHMTMDFVTRWCQVFPTETTIARLYHLQYISPWIHNLAKYSSPTDQLYEPSGNRVREIVRRLVDLTTNDTDLCHVFQTYVWQEIAKLDHTFVQAVLDELVRAAVDAGVGSRRCETIGETVATISSIGVRGRIFAKLRKAFSRTTTKPTQTLIENAQWGEIACLTYLVLASSGSSRQTAQLQLFVPEIAHLITLVAATGTLLVRQTAYGIVLNLVQSMQSLAADETLREAYHRLFNRCSDPQTLQAFGLQRLHAKGDLLLWEPAGTQATVDVISIDLQEQLAELFVKIMDVTSGTKGLLNVWRARWMSLVTSSAFQLSPCVQARSFVVIGVLAQADVDDDLLYQMLVAFMNGMGNTEETKTTSVVSMLRCITKVVPALPPDSRYLPQLFWLGVALLQCSHVAFYEEAARLVQHVLETMERHSTFTQAPVHVVLLSARESLEDVSSQLDNLLGVDFNTSFSFSLVAPVFKGMRIAPLRPAADSVLRTLLRITSLAEGGGQTPGAMQPVYPDTLGYFLALLPVSTSREAFRALLTDAHVSTAWATGGPPRERDNIARLQIDLLGVHDHGTALLVASFVAVMLSTAQGGDAETELLFGLLSNLAEIWPEVVALVYGCLEDRIKDAFSNSMNPAVVNSASHVFRVALQDSRDGRSGLARPSAATLGTIDETASITGPSRRHIQALEEQGLPGVARNFQFVKSGEGNATKLIQWIPELVRRIIS